MSDLIFIGGVGKINEFGGELSKNKLILKRLQEEGYNIKVIDTYGSHRNPLKIISLPYAIIKGYTTPIIFSTNYSNIRLLSKLVRLLNLKRKIIFWAIGGRLGKEIETGKFSKKELTVFNRIIVESQIIEKQLRGSGVTHAEYLPNFKSGKLSFINDDKKSTVKNGLKCVFFSRIQPEKGVEIILGALVEAEKKGLQISVDFYGEIKPEFKEYFLDRLSELSNARYCGLLNFFDGSGQIKLSQYHLSLFPTYWVGEGFPGVIIDAFMAGVPVLASDWNFNAEFINERCGYLCKAKDSHDFSEKLFSIYNDRFKLPEYFTLCAEEGRKYDVERLLTAQYFDRILKS